MHLRLWDLVTTAHQNRARLVQGLGEGSSGNADGSDNSGFPLSIVDQTPKAMPSEATRELSRAAG